AILVAALIAAVTASSAFAKAPASQPIKIKAPIAGKYSITAVSLAAKKAPRLRAVGAVPTDLVVALGVAKDRKHAGRYVGFVALLHKAARKTQAVGAREATFVVTVDAGGAEVDGRLSLRDAILRANSAGDTITFANTTILNGPAGVTGGGLLRD